MLTVSLHGICISAPYGLYAEEPVLGNDFEVDVDVSFPVNVQEKWPFADYTHVREIVAFQFEKQGQLLETLVREIHTALKNSCPEAVIVKVAVRKMHPPMPGEVKYSQVCFEG